MTYCRRNLRMRDRKKRRRLKKMLKKVRRKSQRERRVVILDVVFGGPDNSTIC